MNILQITRRELKGVHPEKIAELLSGVYRILSTAVIFACDVPQSSELRRRRISFILNLEAPGERDSRVQWVCRSRDNYDQLCLVFEALCQEFYSRYKFEHIHESAFCKLVDFADYFPENEERRKAA